MKVVTNSENDVFYTVLYAKDVSILNKYANNPEKLNKSIIDSEREFTDLSFAKGFAEGLITLSKYNYASVTRLEFGYDDNGQWRLLSAEVVYEAFANDAEEKEVDEQASATA